MLTPQQHKLLDFIRAFTKANEYAPSFTEMMAATSLKSKAQVHRMLRGLEERGFIRRLPHRARAIEVVKNPTFLPSLSGFSVDDLAREARRRGLVLGHILLDGTGKRTFRAIAP